MRYKDAGVDLDKHQAVHRAAQPLLGGEAGSYVRYASIGGVEVALHVDGVGTKALWLLQAGRLETAGWDCVVVNVNDVVCDGFQATAVVDYVAVQPGLEDKVSEVVRGVAKAAAAVGAELLGGETAILPDVINGIDVSCTVLAARRTRPRPVQPGDYIVGLSSSGPHANGYSLLRRLFKLDEKICGASVADVLLAPVADYSAVLRLMEEGLVKAAAHITGGSFKKLKRALGAYGAEIRLGKLPCWAEEIIKRGVPPAEAYRVFNMGVGMALVTDEPDDLARRAEDLGLKAWVVGSVKPHTGLLVDGISVSS